MYLLKYPGFSKKMPSKSSALGQVWMAFFLKALDTLKDTSQFIVFLGIFWNF
jgi:hypothetical protein